MRTGGKHISKGQSLEPKANPGPPKAKGRPSLLSRSESCVTTFLYTIVSRYAACIVSMFNKPCTAPGVRSDHLIGVPPYLAVNNQLCLCPYSSLRHWQPCIPFRLPSTYTRPPYPGATPPSPPPLHHLRAFSLPAPTRELLHHLTICARCL